MYYIILLQMLLMFTNSRDTIFVSTNAILASVSLHQVVNYLSVLVELDPHILPSLNASLIVPIFILSCFQFYLKPCVPE